MSNSNTNHCRCIMRRVHMQHSFMMGSIAGSILFSQYDWCTCSKIQWSSNARYCPSCSEYTRCVRAIILYLIRKDIRLCVCVLSKMKWMKKEKKHYKLLLLLHINIIYIWYIYYLIRCLRFDVVCNRMTFRLNLCTEYLKKKKKMEISLLQHKHHVATHHIHSLNSVNETSGKVMNNALNYMCSI